MVNNININELPVRKIGGQVELINGSTSLATFQHTDYLQDIVINRAGEKGKFFGYGICQQAIVKCAGKQTWPDIQKDTFLQVSFKVNDDTAYTRIGPAFLIKDIKKDEKTNVLTLTAYDVIDKAVSHVFDELGMEAPYTIEDVVGRVKDVLQLSDFVLLADGFDLHYEAAANFGGQENLRTVLNAIAEVTQTIYYVDQHNRLIFKRLDKSGDPVLTVHKRDYFELTTASPVTITKLMSVTELGENLYQGDDTGVCQYVRDNPFWNNRIDLDVILPEATNRIAGLTITPYNLRWRGNFYTEVCDKIRVETKVEGTFLDTFILDDSITYNGGFTQTSDWEYVPDGERNTPSNPVTLGEKLNQTFARVDKVNREVTLVASKADRNSESIGQLQITTDQIDASVKSVERVTTDKVDSLSDEIETLTKAVNLKVSPEDVTILVSQSLEQGVDKITTATKKYTFDDEGLNISSSDSEISTTVTEDGMSIRKGTQDVLTANNQGVLAQNLHATTYLTIGKNSRFEDWNDDRTACFWVGG